MQNERSQGKRSGDGRTKERRSCDERSREKRSGDGRARERRSCDERSWGKRLWYGAGMMAWGILFAACCTGRAEAAEYEDLCGPDICDAGYTAYVPEGNADVYVSMDSDDILEVAPAGEVFAIVGVEGDGWMEVSVGEDVGYVSDEQVDIYSPAEWVIVQEDEALQAQMAAAASEDLRRQVVDYAMQFLGCRYVYGGNDPNTGVDCSGFARYVMQNAAGVGLERCSSAQAGQGITVPADQIRPGDLVFYGKGGSVNHVAIYIGGGQVIHASTEKTGVKISDWEYRTPLRIADVLD